MVLNGRKRLLNPGPVTLTDRVRQAMTREDLCHRETVFANLQAAVRTGLTSVYRETESEYSAVLLTGSGTAAVEAMVGSLVPAAGKPVVAANGVYGERIAEILTLQGKPFTMVRASWTEAIDVESIARELESDEDITHVIAVHHETTTGRLNDLTRVGELCRAHAVPLLLDAVSSFGAESIEFDRWNVQACAATANKCLHGVPGVSFVLARQSAFADRESGSPTLYLDLFRHRQAQDAGHPLFTPAVHVTYALHEALAELDDRGGWEARRCHYRSLSQRVRAGLEHLGLDLLLGDESQYASMLSSFVLPPGLAYERLADDLLRRGFVVYPGQASLKDAIVRIAVMGDLLCSDIELLVDGFADVVTQARSDATHSNPSPSPVE